MTMRLPLVLAGVMFVSGCTGFGVSFTGLEPKDDNRCPRGPSGDPKRIVIVITHNEKIEKPRIACARPGDTLWFKVRGKVGKSVSVAGKNAAADWIRGGTNKSEFYVTVPMNVIPEDPEAQVDFEYSIMVDGLPDLDPEVRVRNHY